ncbi:MAG: DUF177 domain-containing protein [Phycisphaerales bacterium]|nr:DUF177 domain-containing protein [Phycisphaerales bacterium]
MSTKRQYEIVVPNLKEGLHHFEYVVDNSFFEGYNERGFISCCATVKMQLNKQVDILQLHFDIDGQIRLNCDRCGNEIDKVLWDEYKLLVKLVHGAMELNETEQDIDIYYLDKKNPILDVATWIYEFVILSIPNSRICGQNELGASLCNPTVLATLEKICINNK